MCVKCHINAGRQGLSGHYLWTLVYLGCLCPAHWWFISSPFADHWAMNAAHALLHSAHLLSITQFSVANWLTFRNYTWRSCGKRVSMSQENAFSPNPTSSPSSICISIPRSLCLFLAKIGSTRKCANFGSVWPLLRVPSEALNGGSCDLQRQLPFLDQAHNIQHTTTLAQKVLPNRFRWQLFAVQLGLALAENKANEAAQSSAAWPEIIDTGYNWGEGNIYLTFLRK